MRRHSTRSGASIAVRWAASRVTASSWTRPGVRAAASPRGGRRSACFSTATVATDGTPIAALLAAGADGFVVAATGAGNTAPELLVAAEAAIADGLPVA